MKQLSDSIEYPVGQPMPGTKWVVHGKLGHGGMGIVLDVVKARLIPGAMKVLHPSFARMAELAERFLEEVNVTAQLQHPNIVHVLDFDRLADGTPFMVMERLRGRTLRAALRETRQRGKTWTPANTYAVAAQVCEGLSRAHLHPRAIVHRDIKPENIYLHRPEGSLDSVVKVMDFGVAAIVGQRDRNQIGTPRYMAPEQLLGDRLSPQTDQYALALVIYEMLTGRLPWDVDVRDVSAIAKVHVSVPPTPASTFCPWLPQRVDAAILKALSKDPPARHESVHGLIFELRALQRLDRFSDATTDAHSTDPMVGTLADGYAVVREDPEAVGQMSQVSLEGQLVNIPDLGGAPEFGVPLLQASVEAGAQGLGRSPVDDAQAKYATSSGSAARSLHISEQAAAPYNARASAIHAGSQGAGQPLPSRLRLAAASIGTVIAFGGVAVLLAALTTDARGLRRLAPLPSIAVVSTVAGSVESARTQGPRASSVEEDHSSEIEPSSPPVLVRDRGESTSAHVAETARDGAGKAVASQVEVTSATSARSKGRRPVEIAPSVPAVASVRAASAAPDPQRLKPRYDQF